MKKALFIANMLFASATVFGMDGNVNEDWKSVRQDRMMQLYGQPQDEVLESVAEMSQKAEKSAMEKAEKSAKAKKSAMEVEKLLAARKEIRNVINGDQETRKRFFRGIQYGLNLKEMTIDDIKKSSSEEIRSELSKRGYEIPVDFIRVLEPETIQSIFSDIDGTLSFQVSAIIKYSKVIDSDKILEFLFPRKNNTPLTNAEIKGLKVSAFKNFSDMIECCKQEHPLHYAYSEGKNKNVIELLVNLGVDINQQDSHSDGDTLLIKASRKGDIYLVKYLVSLGADIKRANSEGFSPLHEAYFYEKEDVMKYLIDNYEDINIVLNQERGPLLHDAQEQANMVNVIISELSSESALSSIMLCNSSREEKISELSKKLTFYKNIIQYLKDHGATE